MYLHRRRRRGRLLPCSFNLDLLAALASTAAQTHARCRTDFRSSLNLRSSSLLRPRFHDRVDFFINASLVHRSLTAWAQERLHDQFLYTYHQRADEHERLKKRFEAGFGANRQLRRLYLDLTGLPKDIDERTKPGADSVSATIDGRVYGAVSLPSGPSPAEAGTSAQEQACDAVAHFRQYEDHSNIVYWSVCAMIATHSEALDTLWLKPPLHDLNIEDLHRASAISDIQFKERKTDESKSCRSASRSLCRR